MIQNILFIVFQEYKNLHKIIHNNFYEPLTLLVVLFVGKILLRRKKDHQLFQKYPFGINL